LFVLNACTALLSLQIKDFASAFSLGKRKPTSDAAFSQCMTEKLCPVLGLKRFGCFRPQNYCG